MGRRNGLQTPCKQLSITENQKHFLYNRFRGCGGMTVIQTLRRPEAVISDFDDLIADNGPLHCKAFRKLLDPLGIRFT